MDHCQSTIILNSLKKYLVSTWIRRCRPCGRWAAAARSPRGAASRRRGASRRSPRRLRWTRSTCRSRRPRRWRPRWPAPDPAGGRGGRAGRGWAPCPNGCTTWNEGNRSRTVGCESGQAVCTLAVEPSVDVPLRILFHVCNLNDGSTVVSIRLNQFEVREYDRRIQINYLLSFIVKLLPWHWCRTCESHRSVLLRQQKPNQVRIKTIFLFVHTVFQLI